MNAAASSTSMLVLVSDSATPCGVEAFARRLAETAGARTHVLDTSASRLARALEGAQALILNLPVVAWKKRLIEPALAAAVARRRCADVVVVLHEWDDLDWKRRASYAPLLPLATAILFSSPEVAAQFAASPASRLATGMRGIVPIPPNLSRPAVTTATAHSARVAAEKAAGRLVIGHFGSIYPKKQSTAVLEVAAALRSRGLDVFCAFVGSFVKGQDRVEEQFRARAAELGLVDRMMVTGYVATDAEVFGILDTCDLFLYSFTEGLTARRGSVLACAMTGRPVIVNAPEKPGAFDHHPTYQRLIADGSLVLAQYDATPAALADAIVAARDARQPLGGVDVAAAWQDAREAVERIIAR
ncbi:MAG: glycosyltransferase family 1 protein [Phreatobacter sp.]|uniref:glycosyltransferase n=1 Tax=Phreatobacter sp. TaxID=1966341 RepID=UPI001A4E88A8|nr:glycosyltransferase family 1 protein [Phreatobacter sp.]MBL8569684.1 glycosyltransferase family 1 protein [Phreatobacter sp.]